MKIPWPPAFEDGDVEAWLQDFEDVAEAVGIKNDRAKLVALRMQLRGRAKAVLEAASRGAVKLEWACAKEALLVGMNGPADRAEAMRVFRESSYSEGTDPLAYVVSLRSALRRALPQADESTAEELVKDQLIAGSCGSVRSELMLASRLQPLNANQLAELIRRPREEQVAAVTEAPQDRGWRQETEDIKEEIAALRANLNKQRKGECFRCGKEGHWKRDCPLRPKAFGNKRFHPCSVSQNLCGESQVGAIDRQALKAWVDINGKSERCLIDTGAAVSLIRRDRRSGNVRPYHGRVRTVGGFPLEIDGVLQLVVGVGKYNVYHDFVVSPDARETILGVDFLTKANAVIDLPKRTLLMPEGSVRLIETQPTSGECSQLNEDRYIPNEVQELIAEHRELFTGDEDPYGYCSWVEHEIRIMERQLKPHCQRRVPVHLVEEVERQTRDMLEAGIIEEADSPYNSPVIMVKKANGKFRFCVDFRQLNEITINHAIYVPSASEIFDQLQNAKLFTVIDLRSGYWQVPICKDDRDKTAFTVANMQYRFKRMPFGLSGAPFTFRRLMIRLLDGLENVVVYGDDIVVFGSNIKEHTEQLRKVLQRISEAGLRVNRSKSQIAKETVTLLGHIVGRGEIRPIPEKLSQLKKIDAPDSKRSLRQFLGRIGFYRRFIKDFNTVAAPLFDLLHKDTPFEWSEKAQESFEQLKDQTKGEMPTLKLPRLKEPFTVTTDASDRGIGAILQQNEDVVEYASRILTPAEQRYSTTEKECLAIVWALEKWRPYLLGRRFYVKTDHKPLEWLKTARDPRGKLARWALRLQEFDFSIGHIPGDENHMADYLSRLPDDDQLPMSAFGANALQVGTEPFQMTQAQDTDPLIRQIKQALLAEEPLPLSVTIPGHQTYRSKWNSLCLASNGMVMMKIGDKRVPLIPM